MNGLELYLTEGLEFVDFLLSGEKLLTFIFVDFLFGELDFLATVRLVSY